MLRDQLDQATTTNQQLTADIHRLTQDWQAAREVLEAREADWREEEKSFNEYCNSEHSRLLSLWRAVVSFRRQFSEMKVATERDLAGVKVEVQKASRSMHSACLNLGAQVRSDDSQTQIALERERSEKNSVEAQLREKAREVSELSDK
ncbi:rootletin [Plakobranchus ocellatus]|nr:rootletin [Plakobranchus ocellatus]